MKHFLFSFVLIITVVQLIHGQPANLTTEGANSPTIIAERIRVTYNVHPSVVHELLKLYEKSGINRQRRAAAVERLLQQYVAVPAADKQTGQLSAGAVRRLGVSNPAILNALNWDVFLSTRGPNSPAIYALGGTAEVWYGLPPEAFKAIWKALEKNKESFEELVKKLDEAVLRYKMLSKELNEFRVYDIVTRKVKRLLEKGEIVAAERLLNQQDNTPHEKQVAFRKYMNGVIKTMLFKYHESIEPLEIAYKLERSNADYVISYGQALLKIGKYKEAAVVFKKSVNEAVFSRKSNYNKAALYLGIGKSYLELFANDSAEKYARIAIEINKTDKFPKSSTEYACYNLLGMICFEQGKYEQAINYLKTGISIRVRSERKGNLDIYSDYSNLGIAMYKASQLDSALNYLYMSIEQVLEINKSHPILIELYSNVAVALNDFGFYDSAYVYYFAALKIQTAVYSITHPVSVTILENISSLYNDMGKIDSAIIYSHKARDVLTELYGAENPMMSNNYNNIASHYQAKLQFDSSLYYYNAAISNIIKYRGMEHPDLAALYNNTGSLYAHMTIYDSSIIYYQKSIDIVLNSYDSSHILLGARFHNMGYSYLYMGKLKDAIHYFKSALAVYKKNGNKYLNEIAKVYLMIGQSEYYAGNYTSSLSNYHKSLFIYKSLSSKSHITLAMICSYISNTHRILKNPDSVFYYGFKTIETYKELKHPYDHTLAAVYINLGFAYQMSYNNEKAIECFNTAISIDSVHYGYNHINTARCYSEFGNYYYSALDYPNAYKYFSTALSIFSNFLKPEHPTIAGIKKNIAEVKGKLAGASNK